MASKILHFIKMSWMLIWRVMLFTTFFAFANPWQSNLYWAALIVSAVSVFGFGKALRTWPIIRALFMRDTVVLDFNYSRPYIKPGTRTVPARGPRPTAPPRSNPAPQYGTIPHVRGPQINSATQNGRLTGFEPYALQNVAVPRHHRMIGVPGAGLQNATGMTQTNISLGTKGEENFAKVLHKTGALDKFRTVWSVPVPSMDRFEPNKYKTDIDCIIETATAVFLVDLKNYKSGDVTYYTIDDELYCKDNATHQPVGDIKKMSRNMEMATNAVRKHFPQANVVPVVVFMPTDKGEGELKDVIWPGNVPAMNLSEFLDVLDTQNRSVAGSPHATAAVRLGGLIGRNVNTR